MCLDLGVPHQSVVGKGLMKATKTQTLLPNIWSASHMLGYLLVVSAYQTRARVHAVSVRRFLETLALLVLPGFWPSAMSSKC